MTLKVSGAPQDGEELEVGDPFKASKKISGLMARCQIRRRRAVEAKSSEIGQAGMLVPCRETTPVALAMMPSADGTLPARLLCVSCLRGRRKKVGE
jgi:hypothetical protein